MENIFSEKKHNLFVKASLLILLMALAGCFGTGREAITLEVHWQGYKMTCDGHFQQQPDWQVSHAAVYVFPEDSENQDNVLLLDALSNCQDTVGKYNYASDVEKTWVLGVPFALNHLNPVIQDYPLNQSEMFWVWQNGHKFLRLDMQSVNDAWSYHLGSVGCQSASAVRPPDKACQYPNRMHIGSRNPGQTTLILHLDRLLGDMTLSAANRCVMHHGGEEQACRTLFTNLQNSPVFEWQ